MDRSLDNLLSSLDSWNSFSQKGYLREYQFMLLKHGTFICQDGVSCFRPKATYVKGDFLAYSIDCEQPIWIIVKSIQFGYPIVSVISHSDGEVLWRTSENPIKSVNVGPEISELSVELASYKDSKSFREDCQDGVVIQTGHQNFAHFIWNELPSLFYVLRHVKDKTINVAMEFNPIGLELRDLGGDISYIDPVVGMTDRTVVKLGGIYIPQESLDVLKMHFHTSREVVKEPQKNELRVWVTVRVDGRTCLNQTEFLVQTIKAIVERTSYSSFSFVFDGFSVPDDYGSSKYDDFRSKFAERKLEVYRYIDHLVSEVTKNLCNDKLGLVDFSSTDGMNVSEAISASSCVDYYISHVGSIQHKVSWIYNPPGFIHGNKASITPAAQRWLQNLIENDSKETFIPDKFVSDHDSFRLINKVDRNRDYHIEVTNELLDFIVEDLYRKVGG